MAAALPVPALADTLTTFARALAADGDRAVTAAAREYGAALDADPSNVAIARRAYREGLDAGDYLLVFRAAQVLQAAGVAPTDAGLLFVAEGMRKRDAAMAGIGFELLAKGPFDVLLPPLRAWAAFGGATDPLPPATSDKDKDRAMGARYLAETRALLQIASGRTREGMTAMQALLTADPAAADLRYAAAQLLAGQGQAEAARGLLAGEDPVVAALRAGVATHGVQPSPSFGVSRLFTRLAADIARGNTGPFVIALTRAALLAEPGNDRARLLLAQALAREDLTEQALATLGAVAADSPFRALAEDAQISVLRHAGERARALVLAQARAEAKGASADDLGLAGDLLMEQRQFDRAARAYGKAIKRAGAGADWTRWLQLGSAHDRGGDWRRAEPALLKAQALAPDEPLVLNYLGYARLDHGGDPAAALVLLERASALKPGDPSITDSLAWGYYRSGDPARAVPLLERAARGDPDNATIAEHLGDAYWAVGRRFEARYAWRAARGVAEPGDMQRLADRIDFGVPVAGRAR